MNTSFAAKVCSYFSAGVLGVAALVSAPYAQAQQGVRVTIPFAFENGAKTLPPGRYTIQEMADGFIHVSGDHDGALTMARAEEGRHPSKKSMVVFHRYGDRYFLREVWTANNPSHLECPMSRSEKRLEVASSKRLAPAGNEVALAESPR